MALTGVDDLAVITSHLVELLTTAVNNAGLADPVVVSGSMPEAVRKDAGCQLSLYLYHVAPDKYQRNSTVIGSQLTVERPLALELYYLLTAFAGKEAAQEQRAMTIAMRTLHDQPILRVGSLSEELTVTVEMDTTDKLGLLWQAFSTPFRLSAVYKVCVTFVAPLAVAPPPAKQAAGFTVVAEPSTLPFAATGQLLGTYCRIVYIAPDSTPARLRTLQYELSPATAAPGQEFLLYGAGLNRAGGAELPATNQVFLLDADGSNERDVTAWMSETAALHTGFRITLALPATVGAAPANAPVPGVYQLRVGGDGFRTNATPISIAAAILGVTNPPLLTPDAGGRFTFNGVGFLAGKTEVLIDTVAVNPAAGAPGPGEFQLDGETTITFRAPANLRPGRYPVRVRVNQVESAPAWWINI